MVVHSQHVEDKTGQSRQGAIITTIFISKESGAPMQSIPSATLLTRIGIEGDRYATNVRKGTYSGRFLSEPGRNLTMVSQDAVVQKMKQQAPQATFTMDVLRRNIVVQGMSAKDLNDMVGREIKMGPSCRLFVHRRNVPCKYREAQTKCPNFMNIFWEDCGVCCEILQGGKIHVGDVVSVVLDTPPQLQRCKVGLKPPGFFTRPAERSLETVKASIIPVYVALALCLYDPRGFEQVEAGYQKVGQYFWSPQAYRAGMYFKTYIRTPLIVAMGVGVASVAMKALFPNRS